jgi:hypothetical protein
LGGYRRRRVFDKTPWGLLFGHHLLRSHLPSGWPSEAGSAEREHRPLLHCQRRNIRIEYRSAAWNRELLADLAAELVDLKVDVIVAAGPQAGFELATFGL